MKVALRKAVRFTQRGIDLFPYSGYIGRSLIRYEYGIAGAVCGLYHELIRKDIEVYVIGTVPNAIKFVQYRLQTTLTHIITNQILVTKSGPFGGIGPQRQILYLFIQVNGIIQVQTFVKAQPVSDAYQQFRMTSAY